MSETIPRWNMPEVDFLETDPDAVKSEIIAAYESATGRTLAQSDPVRLFVLVMAAVVIQLRNKINWAAQQNLLTYAQEERLDALGVWVDVTRLEASYAVTTILFTLSEALASAYVIPEGFEVTAGDLTFATDEELVIPAGETQAETSATCLTAGEAGNDYLAGQINTIVSPMAFLESAVNTTTTSGGSEIESDAEYAERIRLRLDSYSVAGPRLAYIYHAKSYSSAISDVAVISPVPGEVDVYVLLDDGEIPGETFLEGLYEHLSAEDIRPLTDYVVCRAPETVGYSINVDYWISREDKDKASTIREAVETAAEDYRQWQQERIGRDITPAKLIANIMNAGAIRIDSETLSPSGFVELGEDEVAQCTSVAVNFQGYKDI